MSDVRIEIKDADKVRRALQLFPVQLGKALKLAGESSAEIILETEGVAKYPDETSANQPPTPYYIRGRGMQYADGNREDSERYGSQFYQKYANNATEIGNRSSYAPHIGGEKQAAHMGSIGWRKLIDVVNEKMEPIRLTYEAWVQKIIRDLGL